MRSSTFLAAFLLALPMLGGCDPAKAPVTTPPPVVTVSTTPTQAPTSEPAPTSAPTTPPPTTPPPASADASRWVGSWASASCGDRTYVRQLTLKDDKTFTAQDLVSPCPPKVQCIWAGIVFWSGTWALNEKGVVLTKTTGSKDPTKKSNTDVPLQLVWDRAASAPAEMTAAGSACVYKRGSDGAAAKL